MKQIHKAVQALKSDIKFWRLSWILLKKLKNAKKNYWANFLGPICILQIFGNNPSRGVWLYYQILMMAKVSKTEITAKKLKRKEIKVFIIRITPKAFQLTQKKLPGKFPDSSMHAGSVSKVTFGVGRN